MMNTCWSWAVAFLLAAIATLLAVVRWLSPTPRPPTEGEKYYQDAHTTNTTKRKQLPSLFDEPTVALSCIIPAFDESQRLPIMLEETVNYLENEKKKNPKDTYEIILVDDGSRDTTAQVALSFAKEHLQVDLRVVVLEKNRGKGGAVTHGMLYARGERCLMVDADGATRFSDLAHLQKALDEHTHQGQGVAVGSRSHLVTSEAVVKRSFIRNFLMRGFHTMVYVLGIRGIKDTQCGFKLFTRSSAQIIFPNMHVERWIFDIECLMIARQQKIPLVEVQVNWHEIDGSKINLMVDSMHMAKDLLLIRMNYLLGLWCVDVTKARKSQ